MTFKRRGLVFLLLLPNVFVVLTHKNVGRNAVIFYQL
jgi:hypothetical protein